MCRSAKPRSLEQAKAAGADIRPIASPIDAVRIANEHPDRLVVFFAAGFETTTAPVASMLAEGVPENLLVLLSGRLTWPAVALLLDSGTPGFDALIAPGHVSTVMGPEEWEFVVDKHDIPAAIAGFTPASLLAAMYSVLRQLSEDRHFLDNCYPEVVRPGGNLLARRQLSQVMDVVDANWRGIGVIPKSGIRAARSVRRARCAQTIPVLRGCSRASALARCRPAVIARRSCSAKSIPTSADFMARPAHRGNRSVLAWCRTKARAASGGRRVTATTSGRAAARGVPLADVAERLTEAVAAERITLTGHVQGVGFRPFVYRLAIEHGLLGSVQNRLGEVAVVAIGSATALQQFRNDLVARAPPLSDPSIRRVTAIDVPPADAFRIIDSASGAAAQVFVPPDYYHVRRLSRGTR